MNNTAIGKIALISEFPPPAAGMTILAEEFVSRFNDDGIAIQRIRTNPQLKYLSFFERIRGARSFIKWLIFLFDCRKIISSDILHIFSSSGLNFWLFSVAPILIAKIFKTKIIIHYHGGGAKDFFQNRNKLLKFSFNNADSFVVPSGYLQSVFKDFGYDTKVIANFANVERFQYRQRESFNPVVISIRNLTPVYNIQCSVKAFSVLQSKYPEAKMYIIGDGPEKDVIIALVNKLSLENVEFIGNVANEKVPEYFDMSDILINSSNVDNMPGSIIEAFAAGVAVVSTDVGGIPYMVENKVTGLLCGINQFEALGNAMLQVVDNPQQSCQMTKNAMQQIKKLEWHMIKQEWLQLYACLSK